MQDKLKNFILNKSSEPQIKQTNLLISHNRVLEVEEITEKEIKAGWKLSENQNFKILDQDYWKSEELMRLLLEKKKRFPLWLLVILIIIASIFAITILKFLFDFLTAEPVKEVITQPQPIIQTQAPVISKKRIEDTVEEKTPVIRQNTADFERLTQDYNDLQLVYKDLLKKGGEIKEVEIIKEVEVERKFTQKENFIYNVGREVVKKCDIAIKEENEDAGTCKDLYSKFLIWQN